MKKKLIRLPGVRTSDCRINGVDSVVCCRRTYAVPACLGLLVQSMYENDAANGRTKAAEGGPGRWERSNELGKKVIRDDQLAIS